MNSNDERRLALAEADDDGDPSAVPDRSVELPFRTIAVVENAVIVVRESVQDITFEQVKLGHLLFSGVVRKRDIPSTCGGVHRPECRLQPHG